MSGINFHRVVAEIKNCHNPMPVLLKLADKNFQELVAIKNLKQRNGQTVLEHTGSVISCLEDKNDITVLSGLFHDIGKACVQPQQSSDGPKFVGHEIQSAMIARRVLPTWGASEYLVDRVARICLTHMYDIINTVRDHSVRKFIAEVGIDNIDNWFAVRVADAFAYKIARCKSKNPEQYYKQVIEPFRKRVISQLNQCWKHTESTQVNVESSAMRIEGGKDK